MSFNFDPKRNRLENEKRGFMEDFSRNVSSRIVQKFNKSSSFIMY
jgi:hypothetical protein